MQSNPSSATAGRLVSQAGDDQGSQPAASADLNRSVRQADVGEIFRRLDRRSRGPTWMPIVIAVLAILAIGGVVAYQTMLKPHTPAHASSGLYITPGSQGHA